MVILVFKTILLLFKASVSAIVRQETMAKFVSRKAKKYKKDYFFVFKA